MCIKGVKYSFPMNSRGRVAISAPVELSVQSAMRYHEPAELADLLCCGVPSAYYAATYRGDLAAFAPDQPDGSWAFWDMTQNCLIREFSAERAAVSCSYLFTQPKTNDSVVNDRRSPSTIEVYDVGGKLVEVFTNLLPIRGFRTSLKGDEVLAVTAGEREQSESVRVYRMRGLKLELFEVSTPLVSEKSPEVPGWYGPRFPAVRSLDGGIGVLVNNFLVCLDDHSGRTETFIIDRDSHISTIAGSPHRFWAAAFNWRTKAYELWVKEGEKPPQLHSACPANDVFDEDLIRDCEIDVESCGDPELYSVAELIVDTPSSSAFLAVGGIGELGHMPDASGAALVQVDTSQRIWQTIGHLSREEAICDVGVIEPGRIKISTFYEHSLLIDL